MKSKKINFLMIITIIAILLDQLIKIIIKSKIFNSSIILIPHVLNLTYVQNTGAAFGIGSNSTSMFVAVNVVIIGLITYFIFSKKEELSKLILIALHLVLAGGIGNLIDRIVRGFVIDYINKISSFQFGRYICSNWLPNNCSFFSKRYSNKKEKYRRIKCKNIK